MSLLQNKEDQRVRVLVVDDEIAIVNSISDALGTEGYDVESFVDPKAALEKISSKRFDLALIDINMPEIDGNTLAREFKKYNRDAEVIIITGVPDEKNLDGFLEHGFTYFLFKPFNRSQLIYTVYAALHFQRMRKSFAVAANDAKGSKLVGISASIRKLREEIGAVAKTNIPILIMGESGTGKEIVANEVHNNSDRKISKFLPINCAVLGTLADSELFGHAKGAFTGSVSSTTGHVGAAEGGTLFLDEIGELSTEIQAKLLRFLDSGEYMRVGESKLRYADVRIVAATNRDLRLMCQKGAFREDLFYRLSGATLKTEPLSGRKEDILPLIYHFLSEFGAEQNTTCDISVEASAMLVEYAWPGNVRQLKQTLLKLIQMTTNDTISVSDIERVLGGDQKYEHKKFKEAKQQVIDDFEKNYLLNTLQVARGNLRKALELSGMHKKNFYDKINKIGLSLKDFHPQKENEK